MPRIFVLASAILSLPVFGGSVAQDSAKCSPPLRVDLSLDLAIDVYGGGPAIAGRRGNLTFTVRHLGPANRPARFAISHVPSPVPGISPPALQMISLKDSACYMSVRFEAPDNPAMRPTGYYYYFAGPQLDAGDTATCAVSFNVAGDVAPPVALNFTAVPRECHTDTDWTNNSAGFVFGGGAPQIVSAPTLHDAAGRVPLTLSILGILALSLWWTRR